MAYQFDRTDGQRIYLTGSDPVTDYPFAMSCWVYLDAVTEDWITVIAICDDSTDFLTIYARSDSGTNDKSGYWCPSDSLDGSELSAGSWHHLLASSSGSTNHRFVENGTVYTSGLSFGSFPSAATFSIGGNIEWTEETLDGRIAEVAFWSAGHLTTGEEQALAKGVSPLLVRPQSLVSYVPLVRSTIDPAYGGSWTTASSPVVGVHPPGIRYPTSPDVPVVGVGTRTLYAWTMHNAEAAGSNTAAPSFRNQHPVRLFDDTTQEYIHFYGVMPRRALRDRLGVKLTWTSGATSGTVMWASAFERHEDDASDLDSSSFGDWKNRIADAPSSAGVSRQAYIRLGGRRDPANIDEIEPGESFRVSITRQVALDSMADDAELKNVELVEVL